MPSTPPTSAVPVASTPRWQVGNAVRPGGFYLRRAADEELFAALRAGGACAVVAPRQVGKSSLRVRTARCLQEAGVATAQIDLSTIATAGVTEESFYISLATRLAEELSLKADAVAFWKSLAPRSHAERWMAFLRDVVLMEIERRVVLFLDEVDAVGLLAVGAEAFLTSVRAVCNAAATERDKVFERLSFCLLGTTHPDHLVRREGHAPLNLDKVIVLGDFSREELDGFLPGLATHGDRAPAFLDAIFAWTRGHPRWSQKLGEDVAGLPVGAEGSAAETVERIVTRAFFESADDLVLGAAKATLSARDPQLRQDKLLALYRRVLEEKRVKAPPNDEVALRLRLAGVVALHVDGDKQGWLVPRNPVFERVLGLAWVERQEETIELSVRARRWLKEGKSKAHLLRGAELEEAEVRAKELPEHERELLEASQAAARREQRRRTSALGLVAAGLAVLVVVAVVGWVRARQAEKAAESARRAADDATWEAEIGWRLEEGRRAKAIASIPGREFDALGLAIEGVAAGGKAPSFVQTILMEGLTSAVMATRRSFPLRGHGGPVNSAVFSPDARRVLTASEDGTARIWDAHDGRLLTVLVGHVGSVTKAIFLPDGKSVLTVGGHDPEVRLWDGDTGEVTSKLDGHEGGAEDAWFLPGSETILVLFGRRRRFCAWDTSGRRLSEFEHDSRVESPGFSADGRTVFLSSDGGQEVDTNDASQMVVLYRRDVRSSVVARDVRTGSRTYATGNYSWIQADGETALAAGNGMVRILDLRTREAITSLSDRFLRIDSVKFSPDRLRFLTTEQFGSVSLWTLDEGTSVRLSPIYARGAFFADGLRVFTYSSHDDEARIWDAWGEPLDVLRAHVGGIHDAEASLDGTRVVTAGEDGTARMWYSDERALVARGRTSPFTHTCRPAFSADDRGVYSGCDGGGWCSWDIATRAVREQRKSLGRGDPCVAFSESGRYGVTWTDVSSAEEPRRSRTPLDATIWDMASSSAIATLEGDHAVDGNFSERSHRGVLVHAGGIVVIDLLSRAHLFARADGVAARLSPDGEVVAVGELGGRVVRLYSVASGVLLYDLGQFPAPISHFRFGRDGSVLMVQDQEGKAHLVRLAGGDRVVIRHPTGPMYSAEFNPGGDYLLTAGDDATARIWEVATGAERGVLHTRGKAQQALFSPDGNLIASLSNVVHLWTHSGHLLATIDEHRGSLTGMAFSHDSRLLAVTGQDGTVRLYPTTVDGYLTDACRLLRYQPEFAAVANTCARYLPASP